MSSDPGLQSNIARFLRLDSTSVSDALDKLGIQGAFHGIRGLTSGAKICGPAFTVRYAPLGIEHATVGDFLDDVSEGQVVVIANSARTDCTVWGDIMAVSAKLKGIAGTVIDGVCRDVDGIRREDYPMFSRGHYVVTGKDRVFLESVNTPVDISGILVRPNDLIFGDDSGVLRIAGERAQEVLDIAEKIAATEERIISRLRRGLSLREARSAEGYHSLQSAHE